MPTITSIKRKFSAGEVSLLAEDVLLIKYDNKTKIGVNDIIRTQELRKELIGDEAFYTLVDMRDGFLKFSKEAKAWAAVNKESSNLRIMDIFIVSNWAMKLEVRLYQKWFKPINPAIVTTSIEEAMILVEQRKSKMTEVS